jgi:hypothetical protein
MFPFYFNLVWIYTRCLAALNQREKRQIFHVRVEFNEEVPFYRPESLGSQHEDMEYYLSGKNIFGLKGPIIEMEYKQKVLEIASKRDNDLLEYAIYL